MMTRLFALALMTMTCGQASASVEGLWWDPSVSGEGWTFESQNDLAAITWYRYEDGAPAFRTAVADVTYHLIGRGSAQRLEIRMAGRVYRTTDFSNTVDVGAFSGTFFTDDGSVRGTVTAEGETRSIRPFIYNYAEKVDAFRGGWVLSSLGNSQVPRDAVFAVFQEQTVLATDGTPMRVFETSLGDQGIVYYDEELERLYGAIFYDDGTYLVAEVGGGDIGGAGIAAYFNANDQQVTDTFFVAAQAIANSDQELAVLEQILGPLSKRSPAASQGVPPVRIAAVKGCAARLRQ